MTLTAAPAASSTTTSFDLHVRGEIPESLRGYLVTACSRRHKDRGFFSRWHDSQADLFRFELIPGRRQAIRAQLLEFDPLGADQRHRTMPGSLHRPGRYGYVTQPNHGLNIAGDRLWATNLLFGAPLEIDISSWTPIAAIGPVQPTDSCPGITTTSHFAWSLDRRRAYFHQSMLTDTSPVEAAGMELVELDVDSGRTRCWAILPPPEDSAPAGWNFHSAFYFEENGQPHVGLLRTGAVSEYLAPHCGAADHAIVPATPSDVWIMPIDPTAEQLQARVLPGVRELDGLALSHLDVDNDGGDGFVLYANFKEADVGEETHGTNWYGEPPNAVAEHYAGMTVEALNSGTVLRYERRGPHRTSLRTLNRPYDPSHTSQGHTWLPINIELDDTAQYLFCSFSGLRPRLVPRHIADAHPQRLADRRELRSIPPLLMRLRADTLEPDDSGGRDHLSYGEPMCFSLAGRDDEQYVCTFSPVLGLRVYRSDDLTHMVFRAEAPQLISWRDTHFRPDPAHMTFIAT